MCLYVFVYIMSVWLSVFVFKFCKHVSIFTFVCVLYDLSLCEFYVWCVHFSMYCEFVRVFNVL